MIKRIDIKDSGALEAAATIVTGGGIIVYPTDTLYGLGTDATNQAAVDRINKIKGRSGPISVIADTVTRVREWSTLNESEFSTIEKYIGGAQTLILPVKQGVTVTGIQGKGGTLGIRIPDVSFGPDLVSITGRPLTTTSVNRSGEAPLNDPAIIMNLLRDDEIDLLVDAGTLPVSRGSLIYLYSKGDVLQVR